MTAALTETAPGFYIDPDYRTLLKQMGLDNIDGVFAFQQGQSLTKASLAAWRLRMRFQLPNGQVAYLKRYDAPPKSIQLKGWLQHRRHAFLSGFDRGPVDALEQAGLSVPRTIACGGQWHGLFERRSFIITLELEKARSLEKQLPDCFNADTAAAWNERKAFILQMAQFIRKFHETGYRHRDLYLAHIFRHENGMLSLIDLHRCFRPGLLKERFRIKDMAQLHYSCDAALITRADRIRFYRAYRQIEHLSSADKIGIRKIHEKAVRIARHDRKHGRFVPFENSREKRKC
jgi:hypothetical protein